MTITVARAEELGPSEFAVWRGFQRATPSLLNPFLSPEFSAAVGRVRPDAWVAVMSEGPRIVGFFPFERHRLQYGLPIAGGLTGAQGVVHAPGLEWDPQELLRRCGLAAWEFDHLVDGQRSLEPYLLQHVPAPVMDLSRGYDAYLAGILQGTPGLAREVRRKQHRLQRDAGEVRFVLDSRDPEALRTLISWKSAQYRRTGRVDRFAQPWVAELLSSILDTRSEGFACVLALLRAGEDLVAGHVLLRTDDVLAGWFPGFDTRFYRYSPGLLTRLRMAEAAAEAGVAVVHMGSGKRDTFKQTFKSYDVVVAEGRVLRRSPVGALHWARRAPVRRVRQVVTDHPALLRAADRALHRYGRLRTAIRPDRENPPDRPERASAAAERAIQPDEVMR